MSVRITIGTRFPAHATSMGRVLLAGLAPDERAAVLAGPLVSPATGAPIDAAALADAVERAAAEGFAIVDGELETGVRSVAAPVHGREGGVIAAVNVSTSTTRVSRERLHGEVLPVLLDTTRAIDAELRLL